MLYYIWKKILWPSKLDSSIKIVYGALLLLFVGSIHMAERCVTHWSIVLIATYGLRRDKSLWVWVLETWEKDEAPPSTDRRSSLHSSSLIPYPKVKDLAKKKRERDFIKEAGEKNPQASYMDPQVSLKRTVFGGEPLRNTSSWVLNLQGLGEIGPYAFFHFTHSHTLCYIMSCWKVKVQQNHKSRFAVKQKHG